MNVSPRFVSCTHLSKEIFCFYWFSLLFSFSVLVISALTFITYFLMLALCLYYFSFSKVPQGKLRLLMLDLSSFLRYLFNVINFPPNTAIITSHNSDILAFHLIESIFKFILRCLLWPMCYFELCCLISKYYEVFQLSFCEWVLCWLHCGLITYFVRFLFFKFAGLCFMTKLWSIFMKVLCEIMRNVFYAIVE